MAAANPYSFSSPAQNHGSLPPPPSRSHLITCVLHHRSQDLPLPSLNPHLFSRKRSSFRYCHVPRWRWAVWPVSVHLQSPWVRRSLPLLECYSKQSKWIVSGNKFEQLCTVQQLFVVAMPKCNYQDWTESLMYGQFHMVVSQKLKMGMTTLQDHDSRKHCYEAQQQAWIFPGQNWHWKEAWRLKTHFPPGSQAVSRFLLKWRGSITEQQLTAIQDQTIYPQSMVAMNTSAANLEFIPKFVQCPYAARWGSSENLENSKQQ